MTDAASLIDAFLLELRLDDTKLREDQKRVDRAQAAAQKKMVASATAAETDMAKRLSESFRHVRNEALALFGILLGARGVREFVASTVQAEVALGALSTITGDSPQALGAFELAVKSMGGSTQEASSFILGLNDAVEAKQLDVKLLPDWLCRFGG